MTYVGFTTSPLLIILVTRFICCFIGLYATAQDWTYEDQESWGGSCNTGERQSPIAIDTTNPTLCAGHFSKLLFSYDPQCNDQSDDCRDGAAIVNTGHTFDLTFESNQERPFISGGGLGDDYVFQQLHFHWQAEHVLNGARYALEGHFVHYASKYGNFSNALQYSDGLAVVAVIYQISTKSNPAFDPILEVIPKIAHKIEQPVPLGSPVNLRRLLPKKTKHFYRYFGSLTTPNCNEAVVWTVLSELSYLSRKQYDKVIEVFDRRGKKLKNIYRKLQNYNGRSVCINY